VSDAVTIVPGIASPKAGRNTDQAVYRVFTARDRIRPKARADLAG